MNENENNNILLDVKNLTTTFSTQEGNVAAVNDLSFQIKAGETLGVVGESGSGKSQLFMSILGLLANNGKAEGSVKYKGKEILNQKKTLEEIRGDRLSMIFQDSMTSLNPFVKISDQLTEVLMVHRGISYNDALNEAINMLDMVSIPRAKTRVHRYPHEFSGGMRQRVMIAMSLICKPDLLIADEPTTALDVTVQAQILDIIDNLKKELNMAVVMITHDLGVVARVAENVMVMYGGRAIEKGTVDEIFYTPSHPYTAGLLASMPRLDDDSNKALYTIQGSPPNLQNLPVGCAFSPRCEYVMDQCKTSVPPLECFDVNRHRACFLDNYQDLIENINRGQ